MTAISIPAYEVAPEIIRELDDTADMAAVAIPHGAEAVAVPAVYADITARERQKIIPACLDGWVNIKATAIRHAGTRWHQARFHGFRLPWLYLPIWTGYALTGAYRITAGSLRWAWVADQPKPADHDQWLKGHVEAKKTRKFRLTWVMLPVVIALVLVSALMYLGVIPWQVKVAAAVIGFPALAYAGRPGEGKKPVVQAALIPPQYVAPTPDSILFALGNLNISLLNTAVKNGTISPFLLGRDGPGWLGRIILPHGVTATDVMTKRKELSSALRRPLSATWPSQGDEHEGDLELWIGDQDLSKVKPPAWPLAKSGTADLFASIPFGTDPRGRSVGVPMFEINWLIGAAPGQGKTAAVRVMGCGAALDPLCDIWIHELAGKGDLEPFARVAHRYCSGIDDEALSYAAESARLLKVEYGKRSAAFKLVPKEQRPDGKITRELAKQKAFRPLVAVFDEIQNLGLTDSDQGKQAAEDLAFVIRVGRALGIIIVLSTQRPDATMIPKNVTGNILGKFCLMVPGQPENDMVLGTSAYKRGYDATNFRPKKDAGLGWLKGSEDGIPQVTKTYYLDLAATEKIVARARLMRERDGTLSGYALGEVDESEARDVLADVLTVFLPNEKGIWWSVLAERLTDRYPGRWAGTDAGAISKQCIALGVPSSVVRMPGEKSDRGCKRADVEAPQRVTSVTPA